MTEKAIDVLMVTFWACNMSDRFQSLFNGFQHFTGFLLSSRVSGLSMVGIKRTKKGRPLRFLCRF